jgi:hypothetical protein
MTARQQINCHLNNKPKLEHIRNHHFSQGRSTMSMTRILEELIDREHKRLKLCHGSEQATSES